MLNQRPGREAVSRSFCPKARDVFSCGYVKVKIMKLRLIVAILVFTALLSLDACRSHADEYIAVMEVWPPFRIQVQGNGDQYAGIDIDLIAMVAEKLGATIHVKRLPWARCLDFIKSGQADMITGLAYTVERAEYTQYLSEPYYTVRPRFFVRAGNGHRIKTYSDLYQFKIGYSIGSAYFEPFNSDDKLEKVGVSTERQLIEMLLNEHLPVIIGTDCNVAYDLALAGAREKVDQAVYVPEKKTDLYVGLSKNSSIIRKRPQIEIIVRDLIESGAVARIVDKYLK